MASTVIYYCHCCFGYICTCAVLCCAVLCCVAVCSCDQDVCCFVLYPLVLRLSSVVATKRRCYFFTKAGSRSRYNNEQTTNTTVPWYDPYKLQVDFPCVTLAIVQKAKRLLLV